MNQLQTTNWYVLRTHNALVIKEHLSQQSEVEDTFYPAVNIVDRATGLGKIKYLTPGFLFIRCSFVAILALLKDQWQTEYNIFGHYRNDIHQILIPDNEFDIFRKFCYLTPLQRHIEAAKLDGGKQSKADRATKAELKKEDLLYTYDGGDIDDISVVYLQKPFHEFVGNERVRVLSGPYKGYEGFVTTVQKDHKLVLRLGAFVIALGSLRKYKYVVITPKEDKEEKLNMTKAQLVDYFRTEIAAEVGVDYSEASVLLRRLIVDLAQVVHLPSPLNSLTSRYSKRAADEGGQALQLVAYARYLSEERNTHSCNMVLMLAEYLMHKTEPKELAATLESQIPSHPLRPFLTPIYPFASKLKHCEGNTKSLRTVLLKMQEGIYNEAMDKMRMVSRAYQANVSVVLRDGVYTIATNWDSFYREAVMANPEALNGSEVYRNKMEKKECNNLLRVLYDEASPIRLGFIPNDSIYGMYIQVRRSGDIDAAINQLAEAGKNIIVELRKAEGIHREQVALSGIWLRK